MSEPNPTQQFARKYQGIEGFYLITGNGELGFIRPADLKPVEEAFPQLGDADFLHEHPRFQDDVDRFRGELVRFIETYRARPDLPIELGYVDPAGNPERSWRSASLVIYNYVREIYRHDDKARYDTGKLDHFGIGEHDDTWNAVRGIHRGLEDLFAHHSEEGFHRFFPVLYYHRGDGPADRQSGEEMGLAAATAYHDDQLPRREEGLRILNLFWNHIDDQTRPGRWTFPFANADTEAQVFRTLRDNLYRRGVINPDLRVEKRFDFS